MNHKKVLLSLFLSGLVSVAGAAFAQEGGTAAGADSTGSGARGGDRAREVAPSPAVQGGSTPTDVASTQGNQVGQVTGTVVSTTDTALEIKTDTGNRNFIVDRQTQQLQGMQTGATVTVYFDKNANGHDRALRIVSGQATNATTGATGTSDLNRPDPRANTGAPNDSIAPTPRTQTTTGSTYGSQTGTTTGTTPDTTGSTGTTTGTSTYGTQTGTTTDTNVSTGTTTGTTATSAGTTGSHLPRTASDMPLVGLLGLGALAGALAVRSGRNA